MLDEALRAVYGGHVAWHAEHEPATEKNPRPTQAAARLLAYRYPDVPNLGDISAVDWSQVEPVDVLTGGFPCQDVSHAGKRAGLRAGTRSGLWARMCDAIDALRPPLVVAENVRGLLSAEADSAMVTGERLLVRDRRGPGLRALGRVLGDLAELGYLSAWCGLRAADIGAPHGRFRVFIAAWPAQDTDSAARGERRFTAPGQAPRGWAWADAGRPDRTRTPADANCARLEGHRPVAARTQLTDADRERITPADTAGSRRGFVLSNDVSRHGCTSARTGETQPRRHASDVAADSDHSGRQRWSEEDRGERQDRGGSRSAATRLDADPAADAGCGRREGSHGPQGGQPHVGGSVRAGTVGEASGSAVNWGVYGPAVARWERLTRPAPAPTETGPKGGQRLSPRFTEWMQGWPDGWVTDVPGITRNEALRICGNGVVPQQAVEALRRLDAMAFEAGAA